ncbi:MAG: DUF4386 family protein [Anaerolineaceae bacterium]|nr:DUF4386 family protein [Anaerolineaceae bacterium]
MTAQCQTIHLYEANTETVDSNWNKFYKLGGLAALLIVLTALLEILITFLPGGYATTETVIDWFRLFQDNWFLGLRNLGLLNIVMVTLGIPLYLALYIAHRSVNQPFAALAMIIAFIADATFFATNRAFPMLELSHRYAAATTEAQRGILEAAGQALLSVGQSHTPGTYLAFFLSEIAATLMAIVMLRGKVFSKAAAFAGMVGFGCLFIYDFFASFVPSSHDAVLTLAMVGGIASMVWYVLIARKLFQLGQDDRRGAK